MRLKLTDLTIQNLKFQHPQVTYWDTLLPAFGVRVGSRSKTFIVMRGRARKRQTIGHFPATKLADARDRAQALLRQQESRSLPAILASKAVDEYLRKLPIRPRTADEYERLFKRHFVPVLGDRNLMTITPRDILGITDRIISTPTECRHAHVPLQTFFNWCVPRYLALSPMTALKSPTRPKKRNRVLTYPELKSIWKAAAHLNGFGTVVQLCILTGQRRGEISKICRQWIAADTLTIPPEVTKNKREHMIPLTPLAHELALHAPFSVGNWGRKKHRLDNLSATKDWVLHDLRRTFSTNLAELQIAPHVIDRILNHASGTISPIAQVYNRYTYLAEMRDAMERYEKKLKEALSTL